MKEIIYSIKKKIKKKKVAEINIEMNLQKFSLKICNKFEYFRTN